MTDAAQQIEIISGMERFIKLTDEFHTVNDLIPQDQNTLIIPPDMVVVDAFDIMRTYHYSQLPVIAGKVVVGIFSYRSFTNNVHILYENNDKPDLNQMVVRDFIEKPRYVQVNALLEDVISPLNENDYLLVGHQEQLIGIITVADFARYTYRYANILMLFGEIELTLRKIIQSCVSEGTLLSLIEIALSHIKAKYRPHCLEDMTFDNYIKLICHEECYKHFSKIFGTTPWHQSRTRSKLDEIRRLRNDSFHFKREIVTQDIDNLLGYRDWIKTLAEAYEGQNQGV